MRIILLALIAITLHAGEALKTRQVVVLVIDGPRWSETWGEPTRQYIPHMATELAPKGTLSMAFYNDGHTNTNTGHTAITTGVYQDIDNAGHQLPLHPGLPQILVAAGAKAAVVTSKDKLYVLGDTEDPAWSGRDRPIVNSGVKGKGGPVHAVGYRKDGETLAVLLGILGEQHPRYTICNLKEPDASGHAKNWQGYLQGIHDNDARAAELWTWIQHDPAYKDTTTLFVTNDHGRHLDGHLDGFVSHGDDCDGCRHISLLALGPDLKQGFVSNQRRSQIDLAATCAALLGVRLTETTGKVMIELFTPEAAAALAAATPALPKP